jgi:hypothetical protein
MEWRLFFQILGLMFVAALLALAVVNAARGKK